nr:3-dehydroquinate synthase [Cerasicoccus sp. TK19100]
MPRSDLQFNVTPHFVHRIFHTENAFLPKNHTLERALRGDDQTSGEPLRVCVYLDEGLLAARPNLALEVSRKIELIQAAGDPIELVAEPMLVPGGEQAKNDWSVVETIWQQLAALPLSRHSRVLVIGGGAVLDVVGFAVATAHRGMRLVRMPTTTLSQGDSGVGVKCGVNRFGQKNWAGAFSVPWAVVNDFAFLASQPERERRAGLAEALKVALVRDRQFYVYLRQNAGALNALEPEAVQHAVAESARIHAEHIAQGGDPFEQGEGRPLDFGHWAAHKLEQLSEFRLSHGEAVAIGMLIDLHYAHCVGLLSSENLSGILTVAREMGLLGPLASPDVQRELNAAATDDHAPLLEGFEEFRLHLGGQLCLCMVTEPGVNRDINVVDHEALQRALQETLALAEYAALA